MAACRSCGQSLTGDDIGAYKKFVNRAATDYQCMDCLAKSLGCTRAALEKQADFFREAGCTLFPPKRKV